MTVNALMRKSLLALSIAAFTCAAPALATQATPPPASTMPVEQPQPVRPVVLADFDAYVGRVLEAFDVPGIAVAIVKDGKVVLEKGYGKRNVADDKPVDAKTLFAIASNTKAFTAASLSMLADRGKLDMGGRVTTYLPWFRMSDP